MHRRDFLRMSVAGATVAAALPGRARERGGRVVTVTGPLAPGELGMTLPHEHVLVDFIGADQVRPDRYDREEAFAVCLPHLRQLRELGCRTFVECTPAYLGRDPLLLARLAKATGLHFLTNTGYYGARQGKFLPRHAHQESAPQLAHRWLAEWRDGIAGTDVRPGFIKIGVDAGPLPEINRKIVQAAARTHRESGLTIAGHTGDGTAALQQLELLKSDGVAGSAWIWVHAQNERNLETHRQAAERGAWVEFDGISPSSVERHVALVQNMKRHGLLDHVLISHDADWYSVGEPRGGEFRGYDTLFKQFLPALETAGFTAAEIEKITVSNPAQAFAVRVRA